MDNNTCIDCKYFHQLRELDDHRIMHIKSCCTIRTEKESGYEAYVTVVRAEHICPHFEKGYNRWLTHI